MPKIGQKGESVKRARVGSGTRETTQEVMDKGYFNKSLDGGRETGNFLGDNFRNFKCIYPQEYFYDQTIDFMGGGTQKSQNSRNKQVVPKGGKRDNGNIRTNSRDGKTNDTRSQPPVPSYLPDTVPAQHLTTELGRATVSLHSSSHNRVQSDELLASSQSMPQTPTKVTAQPICASTCGPTKSRMAGSTIKQGNEVPVSRQTQLDALLCMGHDTRSSVTVCQLGSASRFSLPVKVCGQEVEAIVDTAAEVTIISDKFYQNLKNKPALIKDVKLMTAGREMMMKGLRVGPAELTVGAKKYSVNLTVAPIENDMLLGFDILYHQGKAVLDMGDSTLLFDGQRLPMNEGITKQDPTAARVTIPRNQVIAPNSMKRVTCHIGVKLPDYIVEPSHTTHLLVPRTVMSGGHSPILWLINATDKYIHLKKGDPIAQASPVHQILAPPIVHPRKNPAIFNIAMARRSGEKAVPHVPSHVRELFDSSKPKLTKKEGRKLACVLRRYGDVFAKDEFDLGTFTEVEHTINTRETKPVKERMRRTPACFANEEEAHLKKMLEAGVIKESISDWASAPVLIRKRDGSVRWCVDYRALNDVTIKDEFPLPLIDDCLDTLAGNVWFSKLDANSAYWQVNIKEEDQKKTAFVTKYGLYEHAKMGFGLCNAPATFARVINLVLRGLNWNTVLAFLDDVLVLGKTFEDHLENLQEALARFEKFGLKLKPKKCQLFQREVEFLGRQVDGESLQIKEADAAVVQDRSEPTCTKHVGRFL